MEDNKDIGNQTAATEGGGPNPVCLRIRQQGLGLPVDGQRLRRKVYLYQTRGVVFIDLRQARCD